MISTDKALHFRYGNLPLVITVAEDTSAEGFVIQLAYDIRDVSGGTGKLSGGNTREPYLDLFQKGQIKLTLDPKLRELLEPASENANAAGE